MALREIARRYGITALIAGVALVVFVRLGYVVADGVAEPFVVSSVQVLTPTVQRGEPIKVVYAVERKRYCTTNIAQFWVDLANGQAMYRDRVPGGYNGLGKRRTTVLLQQPYALPPGHYVYRSVMESDCGVSAFTYPVPDVAFEVLP